MKAKLSKRTVDALRHTAASEGKTVYCYDTAMTGFGAYATAKGAAAYFVQYRLGGRGSPSKRLTSGKHGVITAEQARAIAREKLGEVAKGNDIGAKRKDERLRLAAGSFLEVTEKFLIANHPHMVAILGDDIELWRAHDLRRTAAPGMAALGIQPHIIERVLNHVSGAQRGLIGVYQTA